MPLLLYHFSRPFLAECFILRRRKPFPPIVSCLVYSLSIYSKFISWYIRFYFSRITCEYIFVIVVFLFIKNLLVLQMRMKEQFNWMLNKRVWGRGPLPSIIILPIESSQSEAVWNQHRENALILPNSKEKKFLMVIKPIRKWRLLS